MARVAKKTGKERDPTYSGTIEQVRDLLPEGEIRKQVTWLQAAFPGSMIQITMLDPKADQGLLFATTIKFNNSDS